MLIDAGPAVTNTCGGAVTAAPSSTMIDLAGGTIGAGATCAISVQVTATSFGVFVNVTSDLTSSFGNSGTASDTITVAELQSIFEDGFESGDTSAWSKTVP